MKKERKLNLFLFNLVFGRSFVISKAKANAILIYQITFIGNQKHHNTLVSVSKLRPEVTIEQFRSQRKQKVLGKRT